MNQIAKRSLALLMALIMCIGLLPALQFNADAASYVYNWGTRGVTATELSASAESFYTKYNVSYDELAALTGGTGTSNAPSSALYDALQELMSEAHTYETSYDATRPLFQYTDCQNGGGKISSFYSGKEIGPDWDGGATWNREHTWPNSKGDASGNGENDIMMLRPASVSENSSRGNKAYGEGGGFYNPNKESNGAYNLHGDVARIMLYVYVRWGNTGSMWGDSGVIESLDILLKWMEEDPVDTWELGRNDSVQSITGTRNVFVDYPELAFLLFGEEVPSDYTTPSGEGANACDHNRENFVAGTPVPATCTTMGYTVYTCSVEGCGYSYKGDKTPALGHIDENPEDGICDRIGCGAAMPAAPAPSVTPVDTVTAGTAYKFGMVQSNVSATDVYYLAGGMDGYYMATTTDANAAIEVYLEETTGGYYFYTLSGSTKQYINMVVSGTHVNGAYEATASTVYTWDATNKTIVATVEGDQYWFATRNDNTYTTLGPAKVSYEGFFGQFYATGSGDSGETPNPNPNPNPEPETTITVVETPVTNTAYKLMMEKTGGLQLFFNGNPESAETTFRLATTENVDAAVDVYLEETTGGYYLYFMNGNTKTYIRVYERTDGEAGKGKGSLEMVTTAPAEVLTFDSTYKTLIYTADADNSYYMGTYSTYVTFSVSNTSYLSAETVDATQFPARLVTVETVEAPPVVDPECPHTNTENVPGSEATCTEPGYTDGVYCLDCESYISGHERIPAGHSWMDATAVTPKYCPLCGATQGSALGQPHYVVLVKPTGVEVVEADANGYALPDVADTGDYVFVGWVKQAVVEETEEEPTTTAVGTKVGKTANEIYYALFSRTEEAEGTAAANAGGYIKITSAAEFTTGTYVMTVSSGYGPTVYSSGWLNAAQPTVSGNTVTNPNGVVWTLTVNGSSVTLKDSNGKFVKPSSGNNNGIAEGTYNWAWTCSGGTFTFKGTGNDTTTLASNKGSQNKFRAYKNATVTGNQASSYPSAFTLYKWTEPDNGAKTYYTTFIPDEMDCAHEELGWTVDYRAATCLQAGTMGALECAACDFEIVEKALTSPGEHLYKHAVTNPTCTNPGYTTHTCVGCGDNYQDTPTDPTNHPNKYSDPGTDPTAGTVGYTPGVYCPDCKTWLEGHEEIESLGYMVYFSVPAGMTAIDPMNCTNKGIDLPVLDDPEGYEFLGWTTAGLAADNTVKPEFYSGHYVATEEIVLYALFSQVDEEAGSETGYVLVTNVNQLAADRKVVIVAVTANYAMSTNQKDNNRGAAAITKNTTNKTVSWTGSDVQILTLKAGTASGTYAFYTGSGYLYAASTSANQLKTKATLDANGSWNITIAADGKASISSSGNTSRGVMQYNPNNGSPLFACYGSASQQALALYMETEIRTIYYTTSIDGSCAHTETELANVAEAGCVDNGYTGDLVCADCGEVLIPGEAIVARGYHLFDENGVCECDATAAAQIGEDFFETLQEALEAAVDGDTVKLLKDIEVSAYLDVYTENNGEIERFFTLDLNGFTISPAEDYNYNTGYPLLFVGISQLLTITDSSEEGTGLITAEKMVTVGGYGVLTLAGGTINNDCMGNPEEDAAICIWYWDNEDPSFPGVAIGAAHITGGTVTGILYSEGYLMVEGGEIDVLEISGGVTTVTGGVIGEMEITGGVAIVEEGATIESVDAVAQIGNAYFGTLEEAFAAATNGDTIKLLADTELTAALTINKEITLIADEAVTITANNVETAFTAVSGGKLTLGENLTVISNATILFANGGEITIDGAALQNTGGECSTVLAEEGGIINMISGSVEAGWCAICAYGEGSEIVISGGTVECDGFAAVWAERGGKITVTGGTILGQIDADENATLVITGGSFSVDPTEFLHEDYKIADREEGELYVVIAKCEHPNMQLINYVPVTCTSNGYSGDWYCPDCQTILERGEPIISEGHNYEKVVTPETCGADGYTEMVCSECGDSYLVEGSTVPATGNHVFGAWTLLKAPACNDSGLRTRVCECGAIQTEVLPATGIHTYGEWTETKAPTCTDKGEKTRTCGCGAVETASIAALGHTEVTDAGKPATCTVAGTTDGKHCSVCNEVLTAQETIPALGHTEITDAGKRATCTENGLTDGKHCSVCNEILVAQQTLNATGHSFGAWIVTKEATETEAGVETRTCGCGATETREIPMLPASGGISPVVIIVIVVVVVGAGAAFVFVILKKKRA